MSQNSTMDLTKGAPMRQLLLFSLPLVAGTLFQQLYSFVDTMMVGRLLGEQALAAVGCTHSLGFLVLGLYRAAASALAFRWRRQSAAETTRNSGAFSGTAAGSAACWHW